MSKLVSGLVHQALAAWHPRKFGDHSSANFQVAMRDVAPIFLRLPVVFRRPFTIYLLETTNRGGNHENAPI
jgi:hypothetical protein